MEWERLSTDQLEQLLAAEEASISSSRARQMLVLDELDRRQVAAGDGCKSLSEWVAARLDLSMETAKSLVRTMRRAENRRDIRGALASGEISLDRAEALSRISEDVGLLQYYRSDRHLGSLQAEAERPRGLNRIGRASTTRPERYPRDRKPSS